MSATGRGSERNPDDFYITPKWVVRQAREHLHLPNYGYWLDPCVGDGRIPQVFKEVLPLKVAWFVNEYREEEKPGLVDQFGLPYVNIGDATDPNIHSAFDVKRWDVVITNPPFNLAEPIIRNYLPYANWVVMLLRTNFLASAERNDWLRDQPPDIFQLAHRPSFKTGFRTNKLGKKVKISTDACEYAWFVWHGDQKREYGYLKVLPKLSKELRKE